MMFFYVIPETFDYSFEHDSPFGGGLLA